MTMGPDRHQLRTARIAVDLSLAEVGTALGVSRISVHNLEAGRTKPNADLAERLRALYQSMGVEFGSEGQVRPRP